MSSVIIKTGESNPTQISKDYVAVTRPKEIIIYERDGLRGVVITMGESGIERIADLKTGTTLLLIASEGCIK